MHYTCSKSVQLSHQLRLHTNKLCGDSEAVAHLKIKSLITTDGVEGRVDTAEDSEEDELSSFGDSEEEETHPRVREEVGEIVNAFSTMAVCNVS